MSPAERPGSSGFAPGVPWLLFREEVRRLTAAFELVQELDDSQIVLRRNVRRRGRTVLGVQVLPDAEGHGVVDDGREFRRKGIEQGPQSRPFRVFLFLETLLLFFVETMSLKRGLSLCRFRHFRRRKRIKPALPTQPVAHLRAQSGPVHVASFPRRRNDGLRHEVPRATEAGRSARV